ncbi:hypothetical protein GOP47_0001171 [Adiantum capillus-veneris]|uniref:Uncharacterized protein n=1 Tax=Adiantum capillus-veneris TaxID=13818 RepID=A0A9D4VGJ4_ADICA|nr:hypothetical protein GOP47_0001171 [Adiantum capillus-veneris]
MLVEPLMLVIGFFLFFIACVAYAQLDFSISKSSASYQARIQCEELIDVVSRTALIAGYARHGQGHEALGFFHRLRSEGLSPDAVTYALCLEGMRYYSRR